MNHSPADIAYDPYTDEDIPDFWDGDEPAELSLDAVRREVDVAFTAGLVTESEATLLQNLLATQEDEKIVKAVQFELAARRNL